MSTPSPSSFNPLAGKRGACDRCRGQKLRCIRAGPNSNSHQATCVRCFKAGAICSYGTPKRAGRSPASESSSSQLRERRGMSREEPKTVPSATRSTTNPNGPCAFLESDAATWRDPQNPSSGRVVTEYTADQQSGREPEDVTSIYAHSPSSLQDSSKVLSETRFDFPACSAAASANLSWPDDMMMPFPCQDAEEASGFESFGSKYGWALHNSSAQPMDVQIPPVSPNSNGEPHGDVGLNASGVYVQSHSRNMQFSGMSDETMDVDVLTTGAHTASSSPTNAVDTRPPRDPDGDGKWAAFPDNSSIRAPANPTTFKDQAKTKCEIKLSKESLSVEDIQHRRMQELSKLAMDLYSQLANNDSGDHQPTAGSTTTASQDQLIGSVLKCSNTFLTLLSSFSTPATRSFPFSSSTPTSSMSYDKPTYDFSSSDTSPSSSTTDPEDHAMDEPVQQAHGKRPAGSSDDIEPPPPVDTATVFQLLTCYIRIVHLHSIMHARTLDYMFAFLEPNTQHVDSVPPIFPNMQVGGVSLNRFGTFQIRLLLQISVHVLGEIESALGLPKEYRVGKSKGGRTGLLGASVSGEFLKCLMSEGAWRGKKVESVREQLRDLRRVLRRALNF